MSKKVNCILLVDDNPDDNFYHERIIRKSGAAESVVIKQTGKDALEYLQNKSEHPQSHPDLIFLDINMPGMNGWEFLEQYKKLDKELQSSVVVVMLTSSDNPEDKTRAQSFNVPFDFKTKPLTKEMLQEVIGAFF